MPHGRAGIEIDLSTQCHRRPHIRVWAPGACRRDPPGRLSDRDIWIPRKSGFRSVDTGRPDRVACRTRNAPLVGPLSADCVEKLPFGDARFSGRPTSAAFKKSAGWTSQFVDWAASGVLNRSEMVLSGDVPSNCSLARFRHARFFDFFNIG